MLWEVDSGHLGRIVPETHTGCRGFFWGETVELYQGALPAVVPMKPGLVIRSKLFKLLEVHPF